MQKNVTGTIVKIKKNVLQSGWNGLTHVLRDRAGKSWVLGDCSFGMLIKSFFGFHAELGTSGIFSFFTIVPINFFAFLRPKHDCYVKFASCST